MSGPTNRPAQNYSTKELTKPKLTLVKSSPVSEPMAPGLQAKEHLLGRRRVPRRDFEADVGVLAAGVYQMERCLQVGEGGMMILCERPLVTGQTVVVSFYLPNSSPIIVSAQVRYVVAADETNPVRYGLEFVRLNFQYKREIRNYVASAI